MTSVSQSPVWISKLVSAFHSEGHSIAYFDRVSSLDDSQIRAAKMIVVCQSDHVRLLRQFHEDKIYILLTDDYEAPSAKVADFIFPASLPYVEHQLSVILKLFSRTNELEDEASDLQDSLRKQEAQVEILKDAIVRNVSHELKTPLLQVKAAVSMMAEDSQDEDLVNYAKNAMGRLETLVKNITSLGSTLQSTPGPVVVRDLIDYARRNIGRGWQHQDSIGRITIICPPNLPPVLADKQGISTVLQLLLDNALKFSHEEVELRVVQEAEDKVRIDICDRGIGIAPDKIESIFDIFYQVDPSSTRRYGGTGIGLAIVRLILDQHETQIEVKSEVGKGSIFSFRLSIARI